MDSNEIIRMLSETRRTRNRAIAHIERKIGRRLYPDEIAMIEEIISGRKKRNKPKKPQRMTRLLVILRKRYNVPASVVQAVQDEVLDLLRESERDW